MSLSIVKVLGLLIYFTLFKITPSGEDCVKLCQLVQVSIFPNLRWRRQKQRLQRLSDFVGLEAVRAGLALVSDAPLGVYDVQPVGPAGVCNFGRVVDVVNQGRDLNGKLGHASLGGGAALGFRLGARDKNSGLDVIVFRPGVNRVRLHDVNHEERRAVLILPVKFVERGNLPAKGRSSVAAENENHGALAAKRRKAHARSLACLRRQVGDGQVEVRSRLANAQASGSRQIPHGFERDKKHRRLGNMPHDLTEKRGLAHDAIERAKYDHVNNREYSQSLFELTHAEHLALQAISSGASKSSMFVSSTMSARADSRSRSSSSKARNKRIFTAAYCSFGPSAC